MLRYALFLNPHVPLVRSGIKNIASLAFALFIQLLQCQMALALALALAV